MKLFYYLTLFSSLIGNLNGDLVKNNVTSLSGCYCGSYMFFVPKAVFCIRTTQQYDITIDILGATQDCYNESYRYFNNNNSIALESISRKDDCLGNELKKYGISFKDVDAKYDSSENSIDLTVVSNNIVMKKC